MRILEIAGGTVLVLLLIVALAAPLGPVPGFFIGGNQTAAPSQWPDTSAVDEIKLKVPGTLPRVVIIWVVDVDGELHVVGSRDSGWVEMIGSGSPVEMRLGDETYALEAVEVNEGKAEILQAYVAKYEDDYPDIIAGFPEPDEAIRTAAVYRLNRS